MDRPNRNVFRTPTPAAAAPEPVEPVRDTDPSEPAAPPVGSDPVDWSAAPMDGDVPPTATPATTARNERRREDSGQPGTWTDRRDNGALGYGQDLTGYRLEATDGEIGKIDQSSALVGEQYLIVDTGPWIFGRKVVLPAEVVNHIDSTDHRVYVDRTKDQVKDAPTFQPDAFSAIEYRESRQLLNPTHEPPR